MADDTLSVAAAVLTAEFVRRNELDDAEAIRLWRRIRKRMAVALARESGAHLGGLATAEPSVASAGVTGCPTDAEEAPPQAERSRRRAG